MDFEPKTSGMVVAKTFKHFAIGDHNHEMLISPHQAFRRWKIARKAWKSRKWGKQLSLFNTLDTAVKQQ